MADTDTDEVENFVKAVEEDEYAELELPTGDVLITDWESDGVFNPYVVPTEEPDGELAERCDIVGDAIQEVLEVRVDVVEYDDGDNVAYFPIMDRPDE